MDNNQNDKRPGFLGVGIALGAGIGTALGIAFDNLSIGIALGTGLGLVFGAMVDARRASSSQQSSKVDGDRGNAKQ
jgi:hypothetical protein